METSHFAGDSPMRIQLERRRRELGHDAFLKRRKELSRRRTTVFGACEASYGKWAIYGSIAKILYSGTCNL